MVPDNWFADGQHVLTLAGGVVVLSFQALNLWRSFRNAARIESVRQLVVTNSAEAITELQAAHASIGRVMVALTGERRRPAGAAPANGVANPNIIAKRDALEAELKTNPPPNLQRRFTDRGPA